MSKILKIEKIKKCYGSKNNITKAIDDISFDVDKGEFVAIMGASGSGKTTLLNCISTIDKVTDGKIYLEDIDVTNQFVEAGKLCGIQVIDHIIVCLFIAETQINTEGICTLYIHNEIIVKGVEICGSKCPFAIFDFLFIFCDVFGFADDCGHYCRSCQSCGQLHTHFWTLRRTENGCCRCSYCYRYRSDSRNGYCCYHCIFRSSSFVCSF